MSTDASPDITGSTSAALNGTPLPADDPERQLIAKAVREVKDTTPLAQSFTNFVTVNLVANAQLAAGGTAAMSYLPDDIIDTAAIAKATYINVGTLLPFFKDALGNIARSLHAAQHPWVLDPVAAGIGRTRSAILWAFRSAPPTIVRGNASEIIALAGIWDLNVPSAGAHTDTTRPAGVEAVYDVERNRPRDRWRYRLPVARRQPDDDQNHRSGMLARRRHRHLSRRDRSAYRRIDCKRPVQSRQ